MDNACRVGILRVLTTDDEKVLLSHQRILEKHFPEFDIETKCIHDQFDGIHDEETFNEAFPKIVELAKEWEKDLDGLIISCAGDPALGHLRNILSIPVVGAGISTASISIAYGDNIGIIGIEKFPPVVYREILEDRLIAYELPAGIENTNDLQTDEGKKSVIESALRLKDMGCDVIAFACTGLSTARAAYLLKDIGLPVIDSVIAEGTIMKFMLIEKSIKGSIDYV